MDKLLDAIIKNPDQTVSVLVLLAVIGGLMWVIARQASAHKEALASISSSMRQLSETLTEMRIDAARGRK